MKKVTTSRISSTNTSKKVHPIELELPNNEFANQPKLDISESIVGDHLAIAANEVNNLAAGADHLENEQLDVAVENFWGQLHAAVGSSNAENSMQMNTKINELMEQGVAASAMDKIEEVTQNLSNHFQEGLSSMLDGTLDMSTCIVNSNVLQSFSPSGAFISSAISEQANKILSSPRAISSSTKTIGEKLKSLSKQQTATKIIQKQLEADHIIGALSDGEEEFNPEAAARNGRITMPLTTDGRGKSLQKGVFMGPKKNGPKGPYVLIPEGWARGTDEEYLSALFEAAGIPVPPIVFLTLKGTSFLPPDIGLRLKPLDQRVNDFDIFDVVYHEIKDEDDGGNEEEEEEREEIILSEEEKIRKEETELFRTVISSRLKSTMISISETFRQCDAIYICDEAYDTNEFTELVTSCLPEGGVALGTIHLDRLPDATKIGIQKASVPITDTIQNGVVFPNKPKEEERESRVFYSSNLTHSLVFESEADIIRFRTILQQNIPTGIFCVGGTNPLLDASIQSLSVGSPLIVFKYTTRAGHCLSSLLDYYEDVLVKRDYSKGRIEDQLYPFGKNYFQLMGQFKSKVQRVAYNWPARFNSNAVLHVDPLVDRPEELLLDVVNLMASVEQSNDELGSVAAESSALYQALSMHEKLGILKEQQEVLATIMYAFNIILALTINVTTIVATYISLEHGKDYKSLTTVALVGVNTTLPIVLGIAMTIYAAIMPEAKASMLKYAEEKILSELYKYRCRVGDYKQVITSKGVMMHRLNFSNVQKSLWDLLESMEITQHKMDDLQTLQRLLTSAPSSSSNLDEPIIRTISLSGTTNNISNMSGTLSSTGPLPKVSDLQLSQLEEGRRQQARSNKKSLRRNNNKANLEPSAPTTKLTSDGVIKNMGNNTGVVIMSSEEYIKERVIPSLQLYEREGPKYAHQYRFLQSLVIIASSAGALLAAYNYQLWIPVLYAFVAFQQSIVNFRQLPLKVRKNNSSYAALKKILLWWTSLSLIEQKVYQNKARLILSIESILMSDVEALTQESGGADQRATGDKGENETSNEAREDKNNKSNKPTTKNDQSSTANR